MVKSDHENLRNIRGPNNCAFLQALYVPFGYKLRLKMSKNTIHQQVCFFLLYLHVYISIAVRENRIKYVDWKNKKWISYSWLLKLNFQ